MLNFMILGHPTRGTEIIQLLEMIGGTDYYKLRNAALKHRGYFINNNSEIDVHYAPEKTDYTIYTLEEFLKVCPYKVGDEVVLLAHPTEKATIAKVRWCPILNEVHYDVDISGEILHDYTPNKLRPYVEQQLYQPAIDHASSNHALVKEALIARFMQMPKEDLAAALADITMSNALFKSAMSSLNTQDLCTLDAKVYINGQKVNTTFLDNTQKANK